MERLIIKTLAISLIAMALIFNTNCSSDTKQQPQPETANKQDTMQQVTSKDGTTIAYDKIGKGPALILVNGALATRVDYAEHAKLLAQNFTVYSYDRRGRGNSSNNNQFSVECEVEDLEALIDHAGGSAFVFGSSSGACLALQAAARLGDKVKKLAIYEAPYDDEAGAAEKWAEYKTRISQLNSEKRHGDAVEYHMKYVGAPADMIAKMKASPAWPKIESLAPTLAYDFEAVGSDRRVPVDQAARVKAATLVMDGGASATVMPFVRRSADKIAGAIPNAQRLTVEGQSHNITPDALAPVLTQFLQGG